MARFTITEHIDRQLWRGLELSIAWKTPATLDIGVPENRDFLMFMLGRLLLEYQELHEQIMRHTEWTEEGVINSMDDILEELYDMMQVAMGLSRALGVTPTFRELVAPGPIAPIAIYGTPKSAALQVYLKPVMMFSDIVNRIKRTKGQWDRGTLEDMTLKALSQMIYVTFHHPFTLAEVEEVSRAKHERILLKLNLHNAYIPK